MNSSRDIVKKLRENRILAERKDYEKYSRDELIKMAQDGDQLAIETLVNTHQDFISKMSNKYVMDTADRDDIRQLATIAFWNAIQSWNGSGDFEAYAGMIIKRKMTDELRKEDAEKSKINTGADSLDRPIADDGEGGELTVGSTLQSSNLSPEEEYLGRDGAMKIAKFMREELSEVERKCILKYIEGYKVSEISKEEDMKYKTVENAIRRVKDKLAEYLRNVRESRQIRLSEESIFSDEEKQILKSVISKINDSMINESIDEEDISPNELYNRIDKIQAKVEEIIRDIEETRSVDAYEVALDKLDNARSELIKYEDYIPEDDKELYDYYEEVYDLIRKGETMHPDNLPARDHYAEIGMRRSDF